MNTTNARHTPRPWTAVQDQYPLSLNRWLVEKRNGLHKAFIAEVYASPEHVGGEQWQGTKEANGDSCGERVE
jgi:hypothetical protein